MPKNSWGRIVGRWALLDSQSDSPICLYNASATYVAVKWFFNFDLSRHCNLCRYSIKSRSRMCWDLNIRKPKWLGSSVFKCCNLNTFEISTWLNSKIKYSGEIQWNWIMLPPRHKTPLRYKPMPLTTCLLICRFFTLNYMYLSIDTFLRRWEFRTSIERTKTPKSVWRTSGSFPASKASTRMFPQRVSRSGQWCALKRFYVNSDIGCFHNG